MMDCETSEVWETRTYFAPCCPAQVMDRPRGIWSLDQFAFKGQIGAGHASIVYLVRDKVADTNLALKCYPGAAAKPDVRVQVAHEIGIHARLQHPNIIPLYGAFVENDDILLAMPYASQGSVYDLLRAAQQPFAEDFAVSCIIRPFLSGLAYLHSLNISHRDIKTENVVVDERSQVMIADFGLAIDAHTTSPHLRVGTPLYMAPEVFRAHSQTNGANRTQVDRPVPNSSHVPLCQRSSAPTASISFGLNQDSTSQTRSDSDKADCWSAAVFVYEVLTGSTPFAQIHDRRALERAVLFSPISLPRYLSPLSQEFLTWALNRTPQVRPSVPEMLKSPWLHRACLPAPVSPNQVAAETSTPPSASPHACVHRAAPEAAVQLERECASNDNGTEQPGGLTSCPSRRIIGFAPAVAPAAPSSAASSSLQLTGEAARSEVVQLSGMHRAIIDALRLRSPTCSLTSRSQHSSQPLHKSASTDSCSLSSCGGSASQPMQPACPTLLQRSHSSMLPAPPQPRRPPPRVSSLTQALSLQHSVSLSESPPPSGPSRLQQGGPPPSYSPFACSSQLPAVAATPQPTPEHVPCRYSGVPRANVTVIYACNDVKSSPQQHFELLGVHDPVCERVAGEHDPVPEGVGRHAATMPPVTSAVMAHAVLPTRLETAAAPHQHAEDLTMNRVAASVFRGIAASIPAAAADAGNDPQPGLCPATPGSVCLACGGPGRDGRCGDCQAAADLASIWQRTAGLSPIQRQVPALVRPQQEQGTVPLDGIASSLSPAARPSPDAVGSSSSSSRPLPTGPRDDAAPVADEAEARPPGCTDSERCSSPSGEERVYEVRGSWGGSIDSTAGAMHSQLIRRVEAAHLPGVCTAGGTQFRVASWVANAAAALWDSASDGSSDGLHDTPFADPFADPYASPGQVFRPLEMHSKASQAAARRASDCRNQSNLGPASGESDQGMPALQMWETKGALSSQETNLLGPSMPSDTPLVLQKWHNGAEKGSRRTPVSSADMNSVVQTDQSVARGSSSMGVGSRPLLQSYGVDSSTVSLHALAAALTPSMTGPSLLRVSPVCPEGHDE